MARIPKDNISVSLPMSLLAIMDCHCNENDLDRSQLVGRAVRLYLASKIAKSPDFWEREYHRLDAAGKLQQS